MRDRTIDAQDTRLIIGADRADGLAWLELHVPGSEPATARLTGERLLDVVDALAVAYAELHAHTGARPEPRQAARALRSRVRARGRRSARGREWGAQ